MPKTARLPRVFSGTLLLLALAAALHGTAGRPEAAITNCDVSDLSLDGEEAAFLQIINDYRARNGLRPLAVSENLNRSATWMANDMATRNYFSHGDSRGRMSQQRIADCGATMSSGENLGAGTMIISASAAFELWRTSPGHNSNMLYAEYRQIGIARVNLPGSYYSWYWVTTFDTHDDGTRTDGSAGAAPLSASASLVDPVPGSNIGSPAYAFRWNTALDVAEYWLDVGSCPGCNDIYSASSGKGTVAMVLNLPRDGRPLYVRLSTRTARGWGYQDYTYTAATFQ